MHAWSTKILEANILVVLKALSKFTRNCLTEIKSHTMLNYNL